MKSICSTNPADLVVVSKFHGSELLVTENVVAVSDKFPEAVTLFPDHVLTEAPNTWRCSVSTIV